MVRAHKKTFECFLCQVVESSDEKLTKHMNVVHFEPEDKKQRDISNVNVEEKEGVFKCQHCEKVETTKYKIVKHYYEVHEEVEAEVHQEERPKQNQSGQEICRNGERCSYKKENRSKFVHKSKDEVRGRGPPEVSWRG